MERPSDAEVVAPELPVLGWREVAHLPAWDLRLRAKLDTGARTSALHVTRLEERGSTVDPVDGREVPLVRFDVVLGRKDAPEHHEVEAPVVAHLVVKDTGARAERRPVVRTRIRCGPLDLETAVTLTDRSGMIFRMLLGRTALQGRCLVDPEHGYRYGRPIRLGRVG